MIFLVANLCLCVYAPDVTPVSLRIVKSSFQQGRSANSQNGLVADLSSITAVLSKIAVTSSTKLGASIVHTVDTKLHLRGCHFVNLANKFAEFAASNVLVEDSSFRNSARPLGTTVEKGTPPSDTTINNKRYWEGEKALTCRNTFFIGCLGEDDYNNNPGGAIWYGYNAGPLSITNCTFDDCRHGGGEGTAIYSESSYKDFTLNECVFKNMRSWKSTVHMSLGAAASAGSFGPLTLTKNRFENITITPTAAPTGGGSGLVILYPTELKFIECTFLQCTLEATALGGGALMFLGKETGKKIASLSIEGCVFTQTKAKKNGGALYLKQAGPVVISDSHFSDNKGSQEGEGGFLYFEEDVDSLTLTDVYFGNTDASTCGCMRTYTLQTLNVDNCTIEYAGARDNNLSVWINAVTTVVASEFHMKNMLGGRGALRIYTHAFTDVTFRNCSLESFNTTSLFCQGHIKTNLLLEYCHFNNVVLTGNGNFLQVKGGTIRIVGCEFRHIVSDWALVINPAQDQAQSFTLEGCTFENVSIGNGNSHEAFVDVTRFRELTVKSCQFISQNIQNGILKLGGTSVEIVDLLFKNCQIQPSGTGPLACLEIASGTVKTFEKCHFLTCSYGNGDKSWLVLISASISGTITDCYFESCTCSQGLISVPNWQAPVMDQWIFESISNVLPIRIGQSTSLEIKNSRFSTVTYEGKNLIDGGTQSLTIDNLEVKESTFKFITATTGATVVKNSPFEGSTFSESLFTLNNAAFTVENCSFVRCNGGLVDLTFADSQGRVTMDGFAVLECDAQSSTNLFKVSGGASITLNRCSFTSCPLQGASLVDLAGIASLSLSDSCFLGSELIDAASYITCVSPDATFEFNLPLCFDLEENSSVNFGDSHPLRNLSSSYAIFKCTVCELPLPIDPQTPEPSNIESNSIDDPDTDDTNAGKLSAGAIAGIVVAVIVLIAVIAVLLLLLVFRRRPKTDSEPAEDEMAEEGMETVTSIATPQSTGDWSGTTEVSPFISAGQDENNEFDILFEEQWLDT